jgi:lipopolysaccharide export system permease protein
MRFTSKSRDFTEKPVYIAFPPELLWRAMTHSLINRYLIRELLAPILLCLLVFTLLLVTGRLVQLADLVITKGVDPASILNLLTTMLLPFLAIALPLAFLMGSMIGIGRLCADNEITALRAAGVGLFQVGRPLLLIALGFALLTALVSCWGSPWGRKMFKATLVEISRDKAGVSLQKQLFIKQFDNLVLYTEHIDERSGEMSGVFIVEAKPGQDQLLILADSGRLVGDPLNQALTLQLHNGAIHRKGAKDGRSSYQVIRFTSYDIRPDLSTTSKAPRFAQRSGPNEMATIDLWQAASGEGEKALAARGELHNRLSAPLAPILFALFILPCAVQNQRSGRSGAFVAGLLIYMTYFLLTALAEKTTAALGVHPFFSFWLLHLGFFAGGLLLLRQSVLERPNLLLTWIDRAGMFLLNRLRRRNAHA